MEFRHEPVLLREVLQWMNVRKNGVYCDGTLGGGGHSEAILEASGGTAKLYGIDRDENAIRAASERLKDYPGFTAIRGNFHDAKALLETAGGEAVGWSLQNRDTPDPGSFIGSGKAQEIKELIAAKIAAICSVHNIRPLREGQFV